MGALPSALLLALLACFCALSHSACSPSDGSAPSPEQKHEITEPIVDLGYARYRPTAINQTGQYYNFSNIRYAAAPVGQLRWRAPQKPPVDREIINDGSLGYICPQAPPLWFTQANIALGNLSAVIPPAASFQAQNEDCLFLDVIAPAKQFRKRNQARSRLAPVLVNIHGGGWFIGEKRAIYPPIGLLEAGENGFIYVSINYRVRLLPCSQATDCPSINPNSSLRLVSSPTWNHRLPM